MSTVYELLEKKKDLSTDAVICGADKITYKELYKKSRILGNIIGKESSENIILFMPNSIYYVISYFAVLACDKAVYPISSHSKIDEVVSAIENTKATVILCDADTCTSIKNVLKSDECKLICVDDLSLYDSFDYEMQDFSKTTRDYSFLLNTSGSTGVHKIVKLSQEGILANAGDWIEGPLNSQKNGKVLLAMPAATSFGTIAVATCVMLGWTIVFMPSFFNSGTLLQVIASQKITHLLAIGSMLNILAVDIAPLEPCSDFDCLKFIGIGGNKAVPETMKILMEFFTKAGMSPGYGITEATCIVTAIHPDLSKKNPEVFYQKIDSAGIPFKSNHIRIAKVDGMSDQIGEVLISGPTIMKGYYNNSEATNAALIDGELHTGDLGYIDEEGYLYLVGRIKNIIKSGGYTVFPEEVEEVLSNSDMVKEAYVYGIPDSILDEKIAVDIILNDGVKVDESIIREYCLKHLADYKVPGEIYFVSSIEKTKTGKIKRGVHKTHE